MPRSWSPAQAKSFCLSEIENKEYFEFSLKLAYLAQARGLRSGEHSKLKGASYCHSCLGESFPFGRETTRLDASGKHRHLRQRTQQLQEHTQELRTMAQNENEITVVNPNTNYENKLEKKERERKNNLRGTENEVERT
ncbi:hypothetical protein DEO72_LG11g1971 [Vigna unguiculata]|uniref:Uncharacterized protein n=1 Tax=Vigna unguiculata TaxID=3917 RepID=A0A4D6NMA3_VIGUN|nr:hypothetical protein DEO72_LG11g1971 [Vigna unguiculata]